MIIAWVDVVGCVMVHQHRNDYKSRCVRACMFLSFLPPPLCVCVWCRTEWGKEQGREGGVSRDSTAVQIDECSGLGWVSSMFPIGSDCTVHCIAPPYPQQASRGSATTAGRWKVHENNEQRHTRWRASLLLWIYPSTSTCSAACVWSASHCFVQFDAASYTGLLENIGV